MAFVAFNQHKAGRELDVMRQAVERLDIPASAARPGEAPAVNGPRLTRAQVQENVLSAYAGEAGDPAWAPNAERMLLKAISGMLPDSSTLLSIECRATMCLVQLRHADAHVAKSWLRSPLKGWPGAIFFAGNVEEDGGAHQMLVAIRENTTPPYYGM